jgi:hypothetical protein
MTKEQRQSYKANGYYENGCYEIAKVVFHQLYNGGERSRNTIEQSAVLDMLDYCRSQRWNSLVTNYHIQQYGLKSLNYWFTRYRDKLKP